MHTWDRRYYVKRPFANDPRLAVLPSAIFTDARVLDVGCNEGWVTCEIGKSLLLCSSHILRGLCGSQAQSKGATRVVGVDIDEKLVRLAWKRRRHVWSLQQPLSTHEQNEEDPNATVPSRKRRKINVPQGETETGRLNPPRADYFPASTEHMFGPLPIPPVNHWGGPGREEFPHNVTFRATDWVNTEILEDKDGYDVVLA